MQSIRINESDITDELLDQYHVINADPGDGTQIRLRDARNLAPFYGPNTPARIVAEPPTLTISVSSGDEADLAPIQQLVHASDRRRRGQP